MPTESTILANQILATMEVYYPQYLYEVKLKDHPLVKIAFYERMIEMLPELVIADNDAQVKVEVALRRFIMNLQTETALALRRIGIPPHK